MDRINNALKEESLIVDLKILEIAHKTFQNIEKNKFREQIFSKNTELWVLVELGEVTSEKKSLMIRDLSRGRGWLTLRIVKFQNSELIIYLFIRHTLIDKVLEELLTKSKPDVLSAFEEV